MFAGARLIDPARTREVARFMRCCVPVTTDPGALMVLRRPAELRRIAATGTETQANDWVRL